MKQLICVVVMSTLSLATGETWAWAQAEPSSATPQRDVPDGVSVRNPLAFGGYSLLAPMNSTSTYLIDLEGRIVHEWKSQYTPALSAYLLENGHLLRPGAERGFGAGGPGAGGRIQEFDWDGELVWDYSFGDSKLRPHHDICRLPNGNVLVIASDPKTKEESLAAGRRPDSVQSQLVPECILEVKPTGKTTGEIVWEWHAWDHLIQDLDQSQPNYGDVSEHPELIDLNFSSGMMDRMLQDPQQLARLRSLGYIGGGAPGQGQGPGADQSQPKNEAPGNAPPAKDHEGRGADDSGRDGVARRGGRGFGPMGGGGGSGGDWMHVNSVAYNAKLDQIMLSVHEFSEVWIIDHSTTKAEAALHAGGRSGKGGDLLYRWGNSRVYRSGSNADQRLFSQHSAHWIADGLPGAGHMLVFNNGNGRHAGSFSSVDEIVLPLNEHGLYDREESVAFGPVQAEWSYTAADKSSFYSMLISGAQRLPNGNTLICSGNEALLFEVTPASDVVWKYKHPGGGFGGGGAGGMFRPRAGELVPAFLQQMLAVDDAQKQSLQALQEEIDSKRTKLLTADQRQKLEQPGGIPFGGPGGPDRGRNRPDGQPPAGPGPGGRGRGGFRPPRVGDVIPENLIEDLELSKEQSSELQKIQDDVTEKLGKIWTDDQKTRLKEMENQFARGPGFGPQGGLGPPRDGDPPERDTGNRGRGGDRRGRGGPPGGFGGGGPGGGGPGGIFRSYRYAADYPGLAGKDLTPGEKLDEVAKRNAAPRGVNPPAPN